jgi:hypothetical protein
MITFVTSMLIPAANATGTRYMKNKYMKRFGDEK